MSWEQAVEQMTKTFHERTEAEDPALSTVSSLFDTLSKSIEAIKHEIQGQQHHLTHGTTTIIYTQNIERLTGICMCNALNWKEKTKAETVLAETPSHPAATLVAPGAAAGHTAPAASVKEPSVGEPSLQELGWGSGVAAMLAASDLSTATTAARGLSRMDQPRSDGPPRCTVARVPMRRGTPAAPGMAGKVHVQCNRNWRARGRGIAIASRITVR